MVKAILTVTIILSLVFTLGCSEISDTTQTSSVASPGITTTATAGLLSKWQMNQIKINAQTVASSPLPDLVIETITWSPTTPSLGDTITFSVTIKNQGTGESDYSRVAFYIDDTFLNSASVSPIEPGASTTKTFTWTAQAGSHSIKAVADSNNEVTESNEDNNIKTYTLSVLAPDLIIETITWSPTSPSKDDTVTFSVTIKNQGSSKARNSRVYFYIDGSSRGYEEVPRIDAGATATKTFTWTAQAGSHAIKAIVDKDGWITESDETNNEKTVTISTIPPDLVIEAITWSPESPEKGNNVTFTVTIKNQGSGRADYSRVAFYVDDNFLTSASVNPIEPGASDNKTFTWIAQAGSHSIKVVADPNDRVVESDETNNEKMVTISTAADLIIETITWSPESPQKSDKITFTVTIKNQGNSRAGNFLVHFYVDDSSRGYQEVPGLDASATVTKTFTWIARAGSHTVKAVADPDEEVTESDETNNEKTLTFSTIPPDLIIETITWSPESPSVGDAVTFTVTIKNQGSGKSDYCHVAFYIDETFLNSAYVNPIDPSASDNKTFNWIAQVGSHIIKAVADSKDAVNESDETNNEKTVTFSTIAPDFIIETIAGSPTSPSVGDTVTFTVSIKNQGSGKAGNFLVHFYIDDSSRGYQGIPGLDAGATVTKTFTWIAQAGSHSIRAVADSNNEVTENDETNNEKTITFPAPDLIIVTITWSPESPQESDNVTFTVTIKNQGSGKSDYCHVAFYVDDAFLTSASVNPIEPGASATKTFTWIAQAGSHSIKAVADSNNEVAESNEDNNVKTHTFSVLAPDLVVETITWSPESPQESDNVTFTVTIKNQGSGKSDYCYVAFYIDDAFLNSASVNPMEPGTSVTKTFAWTVQAGSHIIKAVADSNNEVAESDETNNEKTITFPTPPSAPAPTPSTKLPEVPAQKPPPVPSPKRGIWPDLLFVLAAVILAGTAVIVILKSRQR